MTDLKLVKTIVGAIEDKKGEEIVALDLSQLCGAVCDTFIIASGASSVQVEAICSGVEDETFKQLREKVIRIAGQRNAQWIAMDYGNVIVHIFQPEFRDFYSLEELWGDAKRIELK
ncbi:MAG: ribosome silencing factor [Rikenellaceae bacterium]